MMAKSSNERFQNWYLTGFAVIGSFAACSVVPESAQLKLTDDSPKKLLLAAFIANLDNSGTRVHLVFNFQPFFYILGGLKVFL